MEYRSPLGSNFKLQKSLAALDNNVNETPRKPAADFIPIQATNNTPTPRVNNNGNQHYWPDRNSNAGYKNFQSPSERNHHRNKSTPITEYYHPSMVEDPWKYLINKT